MFAALGRTIAARKGCAATLQRQICTCLQSTFGRTTCRQEWQLDCGLNAETACRDIKSKFCPELRCPRLEAIQESGFDATAANKAKTVAGSSSGHKVSAAVITVGAVIFVVTAVAVLLLAAYHVATKRRNNMKAPQAADLELAPCSPM
jgi:hypothetical protein